MNTFLNTYLPWGIVLVTVVICFYVNIIDAGRRRDSKNAYDHLGSRKLEFCLLVGLLAGALLCYVGLPLPVVWGVALGCVGGLIVGLIRRKHGK